MRSMVEGATAEGVEKWALAELSHSLVRNKARERLNEARKALGNAD
jgi:hypothetical protein